MLFKKKNLELKFNLGKANIMNTNPDIEIERIKLIRKIEKEVKIKFKLPKNFLLSDLYIYTDNKKEDPIMCTLVTKNSMKKKLYEFINKKTNLAIKELNSIKSNRLNSIKKTKLKKDIKLEYKSNSVIIPKNQYNRIKKYITKKDFDKYMNFNTLIWILYYRYNKLHLYNNSQGAVNPKYYEIFSNKYKTNVEAFGSFFNHTLKYYFGLFPDLEKYFGCLGNFYLSTFKKGIYIVNPPFTVIAINKTINFLINQLDNTKKELTFLLVIPAWMNSDRKKLNNKCKIKLDTKYEDELFIDKLKKSGYITQYYLYCKENFIYYDYIKMRETQFAPTTLITLSNKNKKLELNEIFGIEDIRII